MSKEIYVVYAPVKVLGDHGFEMVTQAVAVFDDSDLASDEMHRQMTETDCEWCLDTLYLNKPHNPIT